MRVLKCASRCAGHPFPSQLDGLKLEQSLIGLMLRPPQPLVLATKPISVPCSSFASFPHCVRCQSDCEQLRASPSLDTGADELRGQTLNFLTASYPKKVDVMSFPVWSTQHRIFQPVYVLHIPGATRLKWALLSRTGHGLETLCVDTSRSTFLGSSSSLRRSVGAAREDDVAGARGRVARRQRVPRAMG